MAGVLPLPSSDPDSSAPHATHTPTRRSSAMETTPGTSRGYRRRSDALDIDDSDRSACPDIEEPVLVGTKRSRGGDDSEEEHALTSHHPDQSHDTVSAIVLRAKRLRLSDNAAEDRDREVRQIRTKSEGKGAIVHNVSPPESHVSVLPTLAGLPEELVIHIVLDLDIFGTLALRRTNRRLSSITRSRIIWIIHLTSLLDQSNLSKSSATFLPTQLWCPTLEHIVLRPHIFDQKWFRSLDNQQNPASSQVLSPGWSAPWDLRLPILLPGGRWLVAVCDDERSYNSSVCLWDLDHGKLRWLPEAQMEAEGSVVFMDVKMDQSGSFAIMAVLSHKKNIAHVLVHRVDVYRIDLSAGDDGFGFHHIDSLSLNDRRASEVQIYPHLGHVLADLFDRVLIWYYTPVNMCTWIITSWTRHLLRRFDHRSAHAVTCTYNSILVADGDEDMFRAFPIPEPLERPAQLSTLPLHNSEPYFEHCLPSFPISLMFSSNRTVDITTLELSSEMYTDDSDESVSSDSQAEEGSSSQAEEGSRIPCQDPSGRGVLFIDASSRNSYLMCSYPINDAISSSPDSLNGLIWTSLDRVDAHDQARRGRTVFGSGVSSKDMIARIAEARPFILPTPRSPRIFNRGVGHALWIGSLSQFSPSLVADSIGPKPEVRDVVLMRNLDDPGGLMMLSSFVPPLVDIDPGQSRMTEIEQGQAKTVLWRPAGDTTGNKVIQHVRVEEASVDQLSGRVCIVETTTTQDLTNFKIEYRCVLKLLEYGQA